VTDQDLSRHVPAARRPRRLWTAIVFWVLVLLATGLLITSVAIPVLTSHGYTDSSPTMEPAISPGDRLVVTLGSDVRPGDIVVLHHPATATGLDDMYVLRVIGVAGDHVACCNARNQVTVNGRALRESYLYPGNQPSQAPFSVTLRKGQIWVMGDHRNVSGDSREWGAVSQSAVVGRVALIIDGSSLTVVATPRTFVADGLAPAAGRPDVYARFALLAAASLLALLILTVTGIISFAVRWRRSRKAAPPPPDGPASGVPLPRAPVASEDHLPPEPHPDDPEGPEMLVEPTKGG
jgi:signal peptidase I